METAEECVVEEEQEETNAEEAVEEERTVEGKRGGRTRSLKCGVCSLELSVKSLNRHVRRVHEKEDTLTTSTTGRTSGNFSFLGGMYRTKALESSSSLLSKSFTSFPRERGPARLRKSFKQVLERGGGEGRRREEGERRVGEAVEGERREERWEKRREERRKSRR